MPRAAALTQPVTRIPAQRSRRSRPVAPVVPLGSLTQLATSGSPCCAACGSGQVTRLAMQLTDGTPVEFTSCHRCEARRWEHQGSELDVANVLDRTRKPA